MVDDTLLTEETYQVLRRVPATWWPEEAAVDGIANATHRSATSVRGSIAHLIRRRLVERRRRRTIAPYDEIRKVGR